jgi:hypothetical protein
MTEASRFLPSERGENIAEGENVLPLELTAIVAIDIEIVEISSIRISGFFHPNPVERIAKIEGSRPAGENANRFASSSGLL